MQTSVPPRPASTAPEPSLGRTELIRLERITATALAALPGVFATQSALMALVVMPLYAEMLANFGAPLPWLTELGMHYRVGWLAIAVVGAAAAVGVALRARLTTRRIVLLSVLALGEFMIAQLLTIAPHLPVFLLGNVVGS